MNETFLKLYTKDGGFFCFREDDLDLVETVTLLSRDNSPEWLVLKLAESDTDVTLRVSEIQAFYISSPQSREQSAEWNRHINSTDESEPWK